MQVFKTLWIILKKQKASIGLYLLIGIAMSVVFSKIGDEGFSYAQKKPKVAIINRDKDSTIVQGLQEFMGKNCRLVECEDSTEALDDAVFFRTVGYVVIIPEGFSDSFLTDNPIELQNKQVPGSYNTAMVEMMLNRYLNQFKLYYDTTALTIEEIRNQVAINLETKIEPVALQKADTELIKSHINFMAYVIIGTLVMAIAGLMCTFNKFDVRKRLASSPVKITKVNIQFALMTVVINVALFAILSVMIAVIYGDAVLNAKGLLFLLNAFAFGLSVLGIAYILGLVAKSQMFVSLANTGISLVLSFLGGAFVPLELQSEGVRLIARFIPSYWFTTGNDVICKMTDVEITSLLPNLFVQIGFAIAFFCVGLVISKQKRISSAA